VRQNACDRSVALRPDRLNGEPLHRIQPREDALNAPAPSLFNQQASADLAIPEETDEIIDHIVTRYHAVHRSELPELTRLAQRVEDVHANHPACPKGLAALVATIQAEMESHMQKEEQVLFPMMQRGGHPMIGHPIAMMRHEHDEHAANLAAMAEITNNLTLPAEACRTWRDLYAGLGKLAADLETHIHIENDILFPRFGA